MPPVPTMQLAFTNAKEVWITPSKSNPNKKHVTVLMNNNKIDCTCEGWKYQRNCWHVKTLQESLGEEGFEVSLG